MNDEDLEKKLLALTGVLGRPDPTAAWKTDILARARREAGAISSASTTPPLWLVLSWAAAWAVILALGLTTPRGAEPKRPDLSQSPQPPPPSGRNSSTQTLFAFHQSMKLNPDLP